jgi:hypothetical protein
MYCKLRVEVVQRGSRPGVRLKTIVKLTDMSHPKLRVINTEMDNLVSNLRGEVGEIISTWTMVRFLMAEERRRLTPDVAADMRNRDLAFISALRDKLHDEIVARLSELATAKIGRLTFYFAATKLNALGAEEDSFRRFTKRHRFEEKRNYDISHKELPEQWSEHKFISVPYRRLVEGVARASIVMKKIDRLVLGPSAPYLWREMRKKRYSVTNPLNVAYMLLPHLRLSNQVRANVVLQEMEEGRAEWSEMRTKINGTEATVYACKKWGAVWLGDRIMCLDEYPLQKLSEITFDMPANVAELPAAEPILEERDITAKYRVRAVSSERAVFEPVQRLHLLEKGAVTELCDISVNLNAKIRADFGEIKVGDVKDFNLRVKVLTGFEAEKSNAGPSVDA